MFKKIFKASNISQQERMVLRYMTEVNDIQQAGVSCIFAPIMNTYS